MGLLFGQVFNSPLSSSRKHALPGFRSCTYTVHLEKVKNKHLITITYTLSCLITLGAHYNNCSHLASVIILVLIPINIREHNSMGVSPIISMAIRGQLLIVSQQCWFPSDLNIFYHFGKQCPLAFPQNRDGGLSALWNTCTVCSMPVFPSLLKLLLTRLP